MNLKYFKTERLILFLILLIIIFGSISTWLHHYIATFKNPLRDILLFTDSITVPTFISVIFYCINEYWWKTKYFKWLINIPNLNGRYIGKLYSSYQENNKDKVMDCVLEIKQTASTIHITGYFGNMEGKISSSSFSVSEELIKEKSGFFKLYYVFTNETDGLPEQLNNHMGTASFKYFPDKKRLEGGYYNKMKNAGVITVDFQQEEHLGRLIP